MIVLVSCIAANAVEVIPYDKILDDIFANEIKARKSALWEMLMGFTLNQGNAVIELQFGNVGNDHSYQHNLAHIKKGKKLMRNFVMDSR